MTIRRWTTTRVWVLAALLSALASVPARAADTIIFSANQSVSAALVQKINAETVRIDMSCWYLTDSNVYNALLNRFKAGVPVRLIGDRNSIFEIDAHTRDAFYLLASQGVPIRLRYNPTWYPEIDHWKATVFVGQNLVSFGSANYTVFELAPWSSTDYNDEDTLLTTDSTLVNAFKTKFDQIWNDTTFEPESQYGSPPYLKNWDDACATESVCSDYKTRYPNRVPMVINTARLEPNNPMPADLIWGQGQGFNNRLTQEINNEGVKVDMGIYRLTVPNITHALLNKIQAGVPVRIIVEPNEYLNRKWPEFWITHANIDSLWAAGAQIKQRIHSGNMHLKLLITSTYATIASSNFAAAWQRDHDYFLSASGKPAIYNALVNRFQAMWNDTSGFANFVPQGPDSPTLASPSNGAGVSTTPTLTWNIATFATNYDVKLGTSPGAMSKVGNVAAQLVNTPPSTYSYTVGSALQCSTTYYWQIVSRTNASMVAPSATRSFTTGTTNCGSGGGGGGGALPSPWTSQDVGSTGVAGSATYSSGVFTVNGAGADIWGSSDSFQYVSQPVNGDFTLIARVTSEQNTNANAKAGIMLRQSSAANAAQVVLDVKPDGGVEFMTRSASGGSVTYLAGGSQSFPAWLRLARSGSTVTASASANGSTWTPIGTTNTSIAASALVGLLVCSHNTSALNTSTFDSVSLTAGGGTPQPPGTPSSPSPANGATGVGTSPTLTWSSSGATSYNVSFGTSNPPPGVTTGQASASYTPSTLAAGTTYFWRIVANNSAGSTTGAVWSFATAPAGGGGGALPSPWLNQDIGTTGQGGSATFASGTFTVKGSGADIWGGADAFQYAYQPVSGDIQIAARVASLQNTNTWAKAGVMLRSSLGANASHVLLAVTPSGTVEFMTRSSNGAQTTLITYGSQSPPAFLTLARSGNTVAAGVSADGATWTMIGATTVSFGSGAYIGLAVTSHDTSVLNTATFDNVAVAAGPPPPPPTASNVVIYGSDVSALHGSWSTSSDGTSPGGVKLLTPNNGVANANNPLASPADYFEYTFTAEANTPYRIWLRLKALNNDKLNDAVWVQFSDAMSGGSSIYPINTTSGLLVNLATDSSGSSLNNWGWQNTAYWLGQQTTVTFPTTGTHTIRIQIREDGVQLDQIVLSPGTYLNSAPGSVSNDNTIVPKP